MHVALNWLKVDATGVFWHNGATGGYSSFAMFDPQADFAIVVLSNTSSSDRPFADELGADIMQRLAGKPVASLGPR